MIEILLRGVLPPAVLAMVLLAFRCCSRSMLAVAVGGGLLAALSALDGFPAWGSVRGTDRFVQGAALAALLIAASPMLQRRLQVLPLVLAAVGLPFFMYQAIWEGAEWSTSEGLSHVGVAAAALLLPALWTGRAAHSAQGLALPGLWLVIASAGGYLAFSGGSSLIGQLFGALATVLGCAAFWSLLRADRVFGQPGGQMAAFAFAGLLLNGCEFNDLDPWSGLAALGAFAAAGLVELPAFRDRPLLVKLVAGLPALALLGLSLWLGWPEPDPYGY